MPIVVGVKRMRASHLTPENPSREKKLHPHMDHRCQNGKLEVQAVRGGMKEPVIRHDHGHADAVPR